MSISINQSDRKAYSGRWIATINGRIVAHGGTPDQAFQAAQISRHKEIPIVEYVPTNQPLIFSEIINCVRESLPKTIKGYLVGGAVRDALLSRTVKDYDFLLTGNVFQFARLIADKINGAYYLLDKDRGAARVVYKDKEGDRYFLDFVIMQGTDLLTDLKGRDFTINAMAIDLKEPQQLLDPLSGAADLWKKRLRACSPSAFKDDPIRVLRAIRMAAEFGFHILPETRVLMSEATSMLFQISPERIRDELFRILGGPKPHTSIRALDMLGVLGFVLPELLQLKSVSQSAPHIKDVWEHTLDTLKYLEMIIDFLTMQPKQDQASNLITGLIQLHLGHVRRMVRHHIQTDFVSDRSLRSLMFMAALYHDIAKPKTSSLHDDQKIRFLKHEIIGAEIVAQRGFELRLSKKEINRLEVIVKNHMRPTLLAREQGKPNNRAIYRYFRSTGDAGIDICLVSLADLLATYGNTLPQERWSRQLEIIQLLMEGWWSNPEEQIRPPTLVTGHDIIDRFGVMPGPKVGILLEMVREAQVSKEINSREDAIKYLNGLLG